MILGINLHLHTNDELKDKLKYSFTDALDKSLSLGIKITALTCHDNFIDFDNYKEEATKRGMLFIPGIEKTIEGAHVLILNCDKDSEKIETLNQLSEYKSSRPDIFVIAAHPYLPAYSLRKKLLEYGDIFDAVELTWFYSNIINPNTKAKIAAEKLNLPFIATSDAHILSYIEKGYAVIDVEELTIENVFNSIRKNKFENVTRPQSIFTMGIYFLRTVLKLR